MTPAFRKQFLLSSMGERRVTYVMTEGCHPDYPAPVVHSTRYVANHIDYGPMNILGRNDIKDPTS